jgi:hypothetical protein
MGSGISVIHPKCISEMEAKSIEMNLEKMRKGDIKEMERLKVKYSSVYRVPGIYDQWKEYLEQKNQTNYK